MALLLSQSALAVEESAQSFSLDGRLYSDAAASQALLDGDIELKLQILSPVQDCVLYEETQRLSTATTDGYFSIRVGAKVGDVKRTVQDPGFAMSRVYSNTGGAFNVKSLSNAACVYTPVAGDVRRLRVQVTPSGSGGTRILSPYMILESVPTALVAERAETLQGLAPGAFLKVNTTAPTNLSQGNLENVFSTTNYDKLMNLINGGAGIASIVAGPGLTGGTISNGGQTIGIDIGTSANKIVQLDGSAKLPAVDGSALTNLNASEINSGTLSAMRLPSSVLLDGGNASSGDVRIGAATSNGLSFITNGISRLNVDTLGNVGIGTLSPLSKLSVESTTDAIDGSATINGVKFTLQPKVTESSSSWLYGLQNEIDVPSSETSSYNALTGVSNAVDYRGQGNVSGMVGSWGVSLFNGNGSLDYAYGVGGASYAYSGSVTTGLYGGVFLVGPVSDPNRGTFSGTIPDSYGVKSQVYSGFGSTTNAYGFHTSFSSYGTPNVTNGYGLFVGAVKGTNRWSVYASDASTPSYFGGKVGIGTVSPSTALDMAGALSVRGSSAPAVAPSGQGRMYFDSTSNTFKVSQNGGAFADLATVGGSVAHSTVSYSGGSATSPSVTFTGDTNTGFYSPSSETIGVSANGSNLFSFSSAGMVSPTAGGASVTTAAGSESAPTYSFAGDTGTGWWRPSASTMAASTGGVERVRLDSSGNVGIGTNTPGSLLHLQTSVINSGITLSNTSSPVAKIFGRLAGNDGGAMQLYDSGSIKAQIQATGDSYLTGGSLGIGIQDATMAKGANGFTNYVGIVGKGGASFQSFGALRLAGNQPTANAGDWIGAVQMTSINNASTNDVRADAGMIGYLEGSGGASGFGTGLYFYTKGDNSNSLNRVLNITSNGRVGIGATQPNAALEVSGTAIATLFNGPVAISNGTGGFGISDYSVGGIYSNTKFVAESGSASTPTYGFNSNAAGMFSPSSSTLGFSTGGSERMRIISSGNVGIGTTNPQNTLHVKDSVSFDPNNHTGTLFIEGKAETSADGAYGGSIVFSRSTGANRAAAIVAIEDNNDDDVAAIAFFTKPNQVPGPALVERMRIKSESGNVGIGTASPSSLLHVGSASTPAGWTVARFQSATGTCTVTPNAGMSCASDERLKQNINPVAAEDALTHVLSLQAYTYEMKGEPGKTQLGYLAQEVQKVAPNLVRQDEGTGFLEVYYHGLIPWLSESIKLLSQKMFSHEQEMASLKAQVESQDQKINELMKVNEDLRLRLERLEKVQ